MNRSINRSMSVRWAMAIVGGLATCAVVERAHAQHVIRINSIQAGLATGLGPGPFPVPDADGDGTDDIAMGLSSAGGRAFLFSGRTGELIHHWFSPDPMTFGAFGTEVAGINDVDGDGAGDVIVGDYAARRAYVFSGLSGELLHRFVPPTTPLSGFFGGAVAAVPDVNGDGYDDVVVGASSAAGGGQVYVFSGHTGEQLHRVSSPTPIQQGYFGLQVAGLDDVDGDGRGDLLIGAGGEGTGQYPNDRGQAHVFSGSTGAHLYTVLSPQTPARQFSETLASMPDVDGDGYGDFMIGGRRHRGSTGVLTQGAAYLFSGHTGTLLRTFYSPHEDWTIAGLFGETYGAAPPTDGSGVPGVFIAHPNLRVWPEDGVPGEDVAVVQSRMFYFSIATGELHREFMSLTPNPPDGGSSLANWPAMLRDMNGDGLPEITVHSVDCLTDEPSSCDIYPRGVVYVFHSCRVDFNLSGTADTSDFFLYLDELFRGGTLADFNHDGLVNSGDFFQYLSAFYAGCE